MNIKIDELKLQKDNLSVTEILMLKVLKDNECLSDLLDSLQKSGHVAGFAADNIGFLSLTRTGKMLAERLVSEKTDKEAFDEDRARLSDIASAMINIYPKGYKKMLNNGQVIDSPYVWQGSVRMITDRLERFEKFFYDGKNIDKEAVLEATQRYVDKSKKIDEFPFILAYMKTLKYFIYKDGESDLLNYLETEEGEDVYTYDETNGMTIV